jgi:hypothetical protein
MSLLLHILLWVLSVAGFCIASIFDESMMTFSSSNVKTPVDITISLRSTSVILPNSRIGVALPRFSRYFADTDVARSNMSFSTLRISPSFLFDAEFLEGVNFYDRIGNETVPYAAALLIIKTNSNYSVPALTPFVIKVYAENKIGATCGFPSSAVYASSPGYFAPFKQFRLFTLTEDVSLNTTIDNHDSVIFSVYDGIGRGCAKLNLCNGHGQCDYCYETCKCYEGYGDPADLVATGSGLALDCSQSKSFNVRYALLCFAMLVGNQVLLLLLVVVVVVVVVKEHAQKEKPLATCPHLRRRHTQSQSAPIKAFVCDRMGHVLAFPHLQVLHVKRVSGFVSR